MRLDVLEHGHRRRARAALWMARTIGRSELDDVAKISLYRPEVFGAAWIPVLREVLRGPSSWTPAERELFGAFVSGLNQCRYCVAIHTSLATLGLGQTVDQARLDDWRAGGFEPRIAAVFGLLERVTLRPDAVNSEDVDRVRAAGVDDDAIDDALHTAFVFNLINRVASALEFDWASEAETRAAARVLNRIGYRLPSILLR